MGATTTMRRGLRTLGRPARRAGRSGGITVQPYRGYGSREELFLMGRVFRQPPARLLGRRGTLLRDLLDALRRLLHRGVGRATLAVRFGVDEQRVTADRNGCFQVQMPLSEPPPADRLWHYVDLELLEPAGADVKVMGEFFVPPDAARCVVISDIDDTIVESGVANKLRMFWRVFVLGAGSRTAFPGVAALYRAMHHGRGGDELNPMLYVSRGPWGIYEILDEFFHMHRIPVGPILFLREWGLTLQHPLPHRVRNHKLELIRGMLALYERLPFILIGDSGQRDPEIYTQIVREHPGRVLAVYIRNVSRAPKRIRAIEGLAKQVVAAGSSLVLAADSFAMAEHAVEHGLIPPGALSDILKERTEQLGEPALKPTRRVERSTPGETRRAVQRGELQETLEEETRVGTPNVVVGPEADETQKRIREPDPNAPR